MADQTFASRNIYDIFAGGKPGKKWAYVAEAIAPGDAMRLGSDGKIYATNRTTDGLLSGVMALKDGNDIDTDYSAGEWAPYYPLGQDTDVWIKLKARSPAITIIEGLQAILSTTDDLFDIFDSTLYTSGTFLLDSASVIAGRFIHEASSTAHASDMHIAKINLAA